MHDDEAMFIPDGDGYVATLLSQGGWDPRHANGGTLLALVGQCLDEVPTLTPMTLSRFTADIHRPVPLGERLHVRTEVVREGKKIQIVELRVTIGDVEHVRVSALRVREAPVGEGQLDSTTTARPADALAPVDDAIDIFELAPDLPGFLRSVDMRRAPMTDRDTTGTWVRLIAPVVAGRPTHPSARLAAMFDFANLIGMVAHPRAVTMINPDLNAHVLRGSTSEWVAITGDTRFETGTGRGVSTGTLSDPDGPFAFVSISQIIQMR